MNKTKTAITIGIVGLGFLSSLHSNQNSAVGYTPSINKAEVTMLTEEWPSRSIVVYKKDDKKRPVFRSPYSAKGFQSQKSDKKQNKIALNTSAITKPAPIKYFASPYQKLKQVDKKGPERLRLKKPLLLNGDKHIIVKKPGKLKQKELVAEERTYGFWDKRRHLSRAMRHKIIANTVKLEGGYNPDDSNGYPVKYGVNQQFYRRLPGFPKDVKDLTKAQAIKYYETYYYTRSWEHAGYSPEYIAFLLDASVQHGYTYQRFERGCNGNLKCSMAKRSAYSVDWANRSGNQRIIAGLKNRVKAFDKLKIV